MTDNQIKRASRAIKNLSPEQIKQKPWTVLKLLCYNNPEDLSEALANLTNEEIPTEPKNLYRWMVDNYNKGGDLGIIREAAKVVEIKR